MVRLKRDVKKEVISLQTKMRSVEMTDKNKVNHHVSIRRSRELIHSSRKI